ncbi:MAG: endonuclease/exonuclease/phosphatase family protein [Phycisphaerales bacterium]
MNRTLNSVSALSSLIISAGLLSGCSKDSSPATPEPPKTGAATGATTGDSTGQSQDSVQSTDTKLTNTTQSPPVPSPSTPLPPAQIVLDGELDDWFGQTGIRADSDEVFLSFESFDESQAIQAANFTTRIRIDTDGNQITGVRQMYRSQEPGIMLSQGVDLSIEISPPAPESPEESSFPSLRGGAEVTFYPTTNPSDASQISHADVGFYFLPTHNAPRYEARLDRAALPSLQHEGEITVVVEHLAIGGDLLKTQSFTTTLPRYREIKPIDQTITSAQDGHVRVMSTNVLYSAPLDTPEPFTRVHDALSPDVILYQEWFKATTQQVEQWVHTHLGQEWQLIIGDQDSGVAIATKLKVLEQISKPIVAHRNDRPSRVVAAVLETPSIGTRSDQPGHLIVVSLHLKCCGGAGSDEDAKRIAQAQQIHGLMLELRERYPDAGMVIGGDYNLVGSRTPLEMIRAGLGINGQDLTPAPTLVLGTQSMLTWTSPGSSYTPGRLDWLLVDDHAWSMHQSFSLDTARLTNHALDESGLFVDDSRASDHLPIVVDLEPND